MAQLTLLRRHASLAQPDRQRNVLEHESRQPPFDQTLAEHGMEPLQATGIQVLQVNVGKLCNQTCRHCHVDAGPDRREIMTRETIDACLEVLGRTQIPTLDITGGAPEMNPDFRRLVTRARRMQRHVIDRCNLTILLAPGYEDLAQFLADSQVEIVASLPCYLEQNVDAQRGNGVFQKSIAALRKLNALGYGRSGSDRILTLVYNPLGSALPPSQEELQAAYRRELAARYDLHFTRLHTITNMPISRFLDDLIRSGQFDAYMQKLVDAFNPAAVSGVMCRTMLSVDWRGYLCDCDFNQMLDMNLKDPTADAPLHIRNFNEATLAHRPIATGQHCYGCTAGAGSSCQGAIA